MWKYVGGDTFMQTVPVAWKYAELMFSLAEKVDGAVSVKYQLPGEELDPDSLISVSDDSDLQVRARRRGSAAVVCQRGLQRGMQHKDAYAGHKLSSGWGAEECGACRCVEVHGRCAPRCLAHSARGLLAAGAV